MFSSNGASSNIKLKEDEGLTPLSKQKDRQNMQVRLLSPDLRAAIEVVKGIGFWAAGFCHMCRKVLCWRFLFENC